MKRHILVPCRIYAERFKGTVSFREFDPCIRGARNKLTVRIPLFMHSRDTVHSWYFAVGMVEQHLYESEPVGAYQGKENLRTYLISHLHLFLHYLLGFMVPDA